MQLNSPPSAGSRSSDLVGVPLVITAVKGPRVVETSRGEATAVVVDLLILDEEIHGFEGDPDFGKTPVLRHMPDVLIFWSVVQRQLQSDDFKPPVAGKFMQKGKAYTLDELDGSELAVVQGLI